MSGAPIDASEALAVGIINRVCGAEELLPKVLERAALIASKAPLSIRALKRVVRGGAHLPLDEAMALELDAYNQLFTTQDRREGVASFNEKRTPSFRGV